MTKTVHGVVHGKTIELDEELGVAEGQSVEVQVRVLAGKKQLPGPPPAWQPGGTTTAAGMMSNCWTHEDDQIFEEIQRQRKQERHREIPE